MLLSHTLLPSTLLWSGSFTLAFIALCGAVYVSICLRQRLQNMLAFLASATEQEGSSPFSVRHPETVGQLEHDVQQLVLHQQEQIRALQAERTRLEVVLHSMAEGVVVINPANQVILSNRAAQDLFGLRSAQDWQGQPLQALSRDPIFQDLLREVAMQRPGHTPVTRELSLDAKDERHIAVSGMQICEDGTGVSGYVLVFYDLTAIKRLESIRADFVANVSHELRTPLTAIKGYAETLLNGAVQDPGTAQRFLEIIDRHSERLSRLIDDLLILSNLELGKTELAREEVALPELVDEVFEVVKEKAERGGVNLTQNCASEVSTVVGDNDRLHQVLINLIDNAIKYTPAGGTVSVSTRLVHHLTVDEAKERLGTGHELTARNSNPSGSGATDKWVELAVTDTGCGIPEKDLPQLTQRFYRVDKARSRELGGTGLGLAIVKHIVQAHNGFLRIESALKKGTTVRIFLPFGAPVESHADIAAHS
ncbi:MAG: sensor histidine kinase [Candidatus Binatia bacterium]